MNKNMNEYYYKLENAFSARSILQTDLEGLEEFHLEDNKDPYVDALKAKYLEQDIQKHYDILNKILSKEIEYELWTKTPIEAFVYNQLSLYWSTGPHKDLQQSNSCNEMSIKLGHRDAIYAKAELMFGLLGDTQECKVIRKMLERVVELGRVDAYELMIECQTRILKCIDANHIKFGREFERLAYYYDQILEHAVNDNDIAQLVQYLKLYTNAFDEFQLKCTDLVGTDLVGTDLVGTDQDMLRNQQRLFINSICGICHSCADEVVVKYSHLIYPKLICHLLNRWMSNKNHKKIILGRIFLIFSLNRILFNKYMTVFSKLISKIEIDDNAEDN
jgi:hypothetical protein